MIKWLNNKPGKTVLIGISLGGLITNLASSFEDKIDALVSVMYANSIAYLVWNSRLGKNIKKDLKKNGFTFEMLKKHWEITDSSNFKPTISKEKILLISGLYDKYVLNEDTDILEL